MNGRAVGPRRLHQHMDSGDLLKIKAVRNDFALRNDPYSVCALGVMFEKVKRQHVKLNTQGLIGLNTWCIDSTAVKASRPSSGAGQKKGGQEPAGHALGRSRGGFTDDKIHMVYYARGIQLYFTLSGGQK